MILSREKIQNDNVIELSALHVTNSKQVNADSSILPISTPFKKLVEFSATPRGTKKHADFMHAAGTLKNKPDSWKDLFWENMWSKDGS